MPLDSVRDRFAKIYESRRETEMPLEEYLRLCSRDPGTYASAAERLLRAIGEPEIVDTARDQRLGRIFGNRTIARYPAFSEFYGMEETIERIVGFLRHASQGLEERRQILYLLGPVGGGKSSLAERIKALMEKEPIYVLRAGNEVSPLFESPLGLFASEEMSAAVGEQYGIPPRAIRGPMSPWAAKRLEEFEGDIGRFTVVRMMPIAHPADRDRQDRARRREQPGHLHPGWQGRYPPAGDALAERPRCLQLFRRAQPHHAGRA